MENKRKNRANLFASEWNDVSSLIDDFNKQVNEALFCFIRNATPKDKRALEAFRSGLDTLEATAHAFASLYEQEDA